MNALAGTGILTRFHLRRDRVRILVWVAAIVLLVFVTAASTKGLYGTQEDLNQATAAIVVSAMAGAVGVLVTAILVALDLPPQHVEEVVVHGVVHRPATFPQPPAGRGHAVVRV